MFETLSNTHDWLLFSVSFALTFAGILLVLRITPQGCLAAKTNERTNHVGSPRQIGGLVLAPVVLALVPLLFEPPITETKWMPSTVKSAMVLFAGLFILFGLGFVDDLKGLGVKLRLIIQIVAAVILSFSIVFFTGLAGGPFQVLVMASCIVFTLYWINAVNFMDGLDWLTAAGLLPGLIVSVLLLTAFPLAALPREIALAAAGGLLAFAVFNNPPARIFLGDSGSLFLGGVSAVCIISVGILYSPLIAALPFLFYLFDTIHTLLLRIMAREKIWLAHSRHAYQLAYRRNVGVYVIAGWIFFLNTALAIAAYWSASQPVILQLACFVTGSVSCCLTLYWFRRPMKMLKGADE